MWSSFLPCFDIENVTGLKDRDAALIKVCKWMGVEMPCSAMFKMFPTDLGMCCSFNMEAANEIFHSGFYSDTTMELQDDAADGAFWRKTERGPNYYILQLTL